MSEADVVEELNAWITAGAIDGRMPDNPVIATMRRARDEIVALRDACARVERTEGIRIRNVCNAALEEAAQVVEQVRRRPVSVPLQTAIDAIRALKGN